MGTRTTPGGDDHGSDTPTRRSAKQLQQNSLSRPRSGRRAAVAEPEQPVAEQPEQPEQPVAEPSVAGPPMTRSATIRSARSTAGRVDRSSATRAAATRSAAGGPSAKQSRRGGLTDLVDETHLDGESDVEVDVTPAALVAELDADGQAPGSPTSIPTSIPTSTQTAGSPAPRSRRELREESAGTRTPATRKSGRSKAEAGKAGKEGTRRPVAGKTGAGKLATGKPGSRKPGTRRPTGAPATQSRWRAQNKQVWGAAIATALVLLIPGTTLLSPSTPIVDGALKSSNGNLYGTTPTLESTTQDALVPTTRPADQDKTKSLKKRARRTPPATVVVAPDPDATPDPSATASSSLVEGPDVTASPKPSASPKPKQTAEPKKTEEPKKADPAEPDSGRGDVVSAESGLPWASGAYIPGDNPANTKAFGQWRGRGVDAVVTYVARQSWGDMTGSDWLWDAWRNTDYTVVVGIPPFPENSGGSLSACANGDYNDKWTQIATKLKNTGYSDRIVVRLGWEFNGDWYEWKASDPNAFASCWRQVVGTAEAIAPAVKWDWNVNRGSSAGLGDAKAAWPGDKYVDIVGIDSYDWYPAVKSDADWQQQVTSDQGLDYWLNFAKSHGKKISFPEWGLYPGSGASGGDNPFYIQKMMGYFKAHAADLAYESYFNEPDGYIASSIFGDVQNPSAANEYKDVYAAG